MDRHEQPSKTVSGLARIRLTITPTTKERLPCSEPLTKEEHTLQEMIDILNKEGFVTSQGCSFSKSTVYKLIKRYNLKRIKIMEPRYVLILDFCIGYLNIIKLTDEELRESENYEDFEDFSFYH